MHEHLEQIYYTNAILCIHVRAHICAYTELQYHETDMRTPMAKCSCLQR